MLSIFRYEIAVAGMDKETVVPRETFCFQNRVPETSRRRLVNPYQGRIVNHLVECLQFLGRTVQTLTVKLRNKREVGREMILDRPLPPPHDKTEVSEPNRVQLLKDQLYDGFQTQVSIHSPREDRQHLFRLFLCDRQEPSSHPCCR